MRSSSAIALFDSFALEACRALGRRLLQDRDFVLARTAKRGRTALNDADESFKCHHDVILAAATQKGKALEDTDESLRRDRVVLLAAVERNGEVLRYADVSFRRDREVVSAAVTSNGYSLKFTNYSLRSDRELVLAAAARQSTAIGTCKTIRSFHCNNTHY